MKWYEDYDREHDENQKKKELEFERELFETWLKFQTELHAVKMQQETKHLVMTLTGESNKGVQAKLPREKKRRN